MIKQNYLDSRITEFIKEHHLTTLTVAAGGDIWSWHAFYVFIEEENVFVITSEQKTRHISLFLTDPQKRVAGAIGLETEQIGLIRGVQFKAEMELCSQPFLNRYRLRYLRRFPYAVLKGGDLWVVRITELKFTDNRLGFGKKLLWNSKD